MVGEEEKEENTHTSDFNMKSELQSLVKSKMIPQQIADKLLTKLQEKNITLTKDQLYILINKINQVILSFKKKKESEADNGQGKENKDEKQFDQNEETIADIHILFEKIDDLRVQIDQLKKNNVQDVTIDSNDSADSLEQNDEDHLYTTDDIIVPDMDEVSSKIGKTQPLSIIPNNPESIIVLMNWLQYLIDQCGYENLDTILEYYVDINWITDDVKMGLLDYSQGIKKEKKTTASKDEANQTILPSKDHIQSYMFIQKLKGKKFDKHFVDKIQNDLTRLRKKVEKYQQFQSE